MKKIIIALSTLVPLASPIIMASTDVNQILSKSKFTYNPQQVWVQNKSLFPVFSLLSPPKYIDGVYYETPVGVGVGRGLWTSKNGKNWTRNQSIGIYTRSESNVVKLKNTYFLATDAHGLWTSKNGKSWMQNKSLSTLPWFWCAPTLINNIYFLASNGRGLFESMNGKTWFQNKSVDSFGSFTNPTFIGSTYYLPSDNGLYTSQDGRHWNLNRDISGIPIKYPPVKIGKTFYLTTGITSGDHAIGAGLYTSTNGQNWSKNKTIPNKTATVGQVKFFNGKYYIATHDHGLYTSTNGQNWVQNTNFPKNGDVNLINNLTYIDGAYYLNTTGIEAIDPRVVHGALWTSPNGLTWIKNNSFKNYASGLFAPVKIKDTLFMGQYFNGLWSTNL